MAGGFTVKESIERSPEEVWAYLTDFGNAKKWMTGVEEMSQINQGPIEVGTRFRFKARGKERESEVTASSPGWSNLSLSSSIIYTKLSGGSRGDDAFTDASMPPSRWSEPEPPETGWQ